MIFLFSAFFILGSIVGSFLNVVADRTMNGQSIIFGRSKCDFCNAKLSTFDLVPILSFLGLRARCRYCNHKLSWQYPIVETLVGVLFVLTLNFFVSQASTSLASLFYYLVVICTLVVVSIVDFKFSLVPTAFVFAASLFALFWNYFSLSSSDFVLSVVSAFILAFGFLVIVILTRGRGMGTGDIPVVFLIGLFLGWPDSIAAIFAAFLSGAVISVLLLIIGRKRLGQTIPFAPFLVLGTLVILFWGEQIISWYLRLL